MRAQNEVTYIAESEAEESKAIIVLLVCVLGIVAACLAAWTGFMVASELSSRSVVIYAKSELTKDQLRIIKAPGENHAPGR